MIDDRLAHRLRRHCPTLWPLLVQWDHERDDDQLVDSIRGLGLPSADRGIKGMGVYEVEATGEDRWADWQTGTTDEVEYLRTAAPWFPRPLAHRLMSGG